MDGYHSIILVFAAGLLSFLSPCVLPLIPSYLGILGGMRHTEETQRKSALLVATVFFILGFSVVFIVLSIIMSATFLLMGGASLYIRIIAGAVVIALGLNVLFGFIPALNYEKRFNAMGKFRGLPGVFIAGAAFGAGWTPCIGPMLAGVLFLAGQGGKAGIAALYLGIYSLGLGLPFLLAAVFFDRFLVTSTWFKKHFPLIQKASGILLIVIGLLVLSGQFSALNAALQKWQYMHYTL